MMIYNLREYLNKIIIKTQLFITDINDNFPVLGSPLLIIWNTLHWLKFIVSIRIYKLKNNITQYHIKWIEDINPNIIKISEKDINKNKNSFIDNNTTVNINKNGNIILIDGLTWYNQYLRYNMSIDAMVNKRHRKWIKFKEKIAYFIRKNDILYQKLTHPDLKEFNFKHGHERYKLIKDNLTIKNGTLLDIGTNFGYFCHMMEDLGFDCYGVEENMYYAYFLKKLKKAENKKFKIIQKSIFSYNKKKELKFDIVLALFIFHHFLKRKNTYNNLIKFLNRLNVKEMYFGSHNPKEQQNIGGYINYEPEEFVQFIIENSCLNNYKLIGIIENNNRHIYKLTK